MIGIYQILNTENNKRYIGSSVQVEERLKQHKRALVRGNHDNDYLQRAWNSSDKVCFKFELLVVCNKNDLIFYEDLIIKGYKSNGRELGYNLRDVALTNSGMKIPSRHLDNPGDKYNNLTLLEEVPTSKQRRVYWKCKCDCGNIKEYSISYVKTNHTKSCGCLRKVKARITGLRNRKNVV